MHTAGRGLGNAMQYFQNDCSTLFSQAFFCRFHKIGIGYRGMVTFPNDKFLDSSKLKVFADNNFKFDENG